MRIVACSQALRLFRLPRARALAFPCLDIARRRALRWRELNAKDRAVTKRVEPSVALVEANMPPEAFAAEEDWQPAPDSNSHLVILFDSGATPSCCRARHDRRRRCMRVVRLCVRRRTLSCRVVFRLPRKAQPASALQRRFSRFRI